MIKEIRAATIFILALFCVSLGTFSQIRESGIIHGKVYDENGDVFPGATLTVSGPTLIGGARMYISDYKGYYRFPSLPPGPYTVSCELPGFTKVVREVIRLHTGTSLTVDFEMIQAKVTEEVLVIAQAPTIDIKSSSVASVVMTDDLLVSVPTSKAFADLLNIAPGASTNSSYASGHYAANTYQIDGISVDNPKYSGIANEPDFNIIQEVKVQALGLSSEYGEFTGAIINAITKSGSNKFSGMAEFRYNGEGWNNDNLKDIPVEDFISPTVKETKYSSNSLIDFGAQLGGPFLKDKLWFFGSGQYYKVDEYYLGVPDEPRVNDALKFFGKLTFYVNTSNRINLSINHDKRTTRNRIVYGTPSLVSTEAKLNMDYPCWLIDASWTSIISPRTFLDVKLGYNYVNQKNLMGYDGPTYRDLITGAITGGWFDHDAENIDSSYHLNAHLSHYIPEFIKGSHDVKVGTELMILSSVAKNVGRVYPQYQLRNGQPYIRTFSQGGPTTIDRIGRTLVGFIQDSWSLGQRLTLNLGLRYNYYWFDMPGALDSPYKESSIAPRLGFTFDILGDHKNILKFHYGHYFEALYSDLFVYAENRYNPTIYEIWNGTEYVFLRSYYQAGQELDENLKQPFIREVIFGYERELFKDASLAVNFFYRTLGRVVGVVDMTGEFEKRQVVNPGPDGEIGTSDDSSIDIWWQLNPGESVYRVTNPDQVTAQSLVDKEKKLIRGLQVIFSKKFSNNWQLIASYQYADCKGYDLYNSGTLSRFGQNPNYFVNTYGQLKYAQPHQFKLQGNVVLPLEFNLGVIAEYMSGSPFYAYFYTLTSAGNQRILGVPAGEEKTEAYTNIDLRLEKRFNVLNGKFTLFADVYNLTNRHTPNWYNIYGPNYKKIQGVSTPRVFRIGFRCMF